VPFAHDGEARIQNSALALVQAVENFALLEDGRFGRIDVLAFVISGQHPATERDHAPLLIANRKHQPPAKPIVMAVGVLLANDQPALLHQRHVIALAGGPIHRVIPLLGRVAETEQLHRLRRDAAFGEVIARDLAAGIIGQHRLPALRDLLVDLEQLVLEKLRFLLSRALLEIERDFRPLRQTLHRFDKREIFVFANKRNDIAALVAAEAMENLPMRIDIEARGLFPMKRTERDKSAPGAFQRQNRADHVHDIARGANLLQSCRRNKSHA
jgi:hypothetical protein